MTALCAHYLLQQRVAKKNVFHCQREKPGEGGLREIYSEKYRIPDSNTLEKMSSRDGRSESTSTKAKMFIILRADDTWQTIARDAMLHWDNIA
jgi:hypothetical protein